jgi:hypothetical protein
VSLSLTFGFDLGRRHAVPPNNRAVFAKFEGRSGNQMGMGEAGGARSIAPRVGGFVSGGAMLRAPGRLRGGATVQGPAFGSCGFFRHARIN